ncbi:MAG: putative sulfate exporter family transporter [SAR202 cluster bacterium]|mgnify:FL=1|nr:putative sulfate exporter family transporter [SAR202 cluster bacterium]
MNLISIKENLPGLIFCFIFGIIIYFLFENFEIKFIDTLLSGLLVGVVIKNIKFLPDLSILDKGSKFAGKHILEFSVMLMGASIFLPDLFENGIKLFIVIVIAIIGSMLISYLVGYKLLKLDKKLSTLVGVGNSICGNSAVAVIAPVIGASSTQIGAAIGISAILGASQIILLPLLVPAFGLGDYQYGVVAGLSVYAVAQVVAASSIISPLSANVATVVKLTRVVLLAPLVLVLRFFYKSEDSDSDSNLVTTILKFLPWFVIGFLLLAIFRSTEVISNDLGLNIRSTAKFLFIISMVAIGLSVDLKEMIKVGPKVVITILTIIAFMILLGVFSSSFIN